MRKSFCEKSIANLKLVPSVPLYHSAFYYRLSIYCVPGMPLCVCVYIYIHIYICIYIYVCIYMYIYMYVYICICMYVYIHTVSFGIYIVLFKPFIIHLLEMGTVFALIFKWENWGSVRLNKVTDSTQVVNAKLVSQKKKKKKACFSLTTLLTTPWRAVWSLGTEARRAEARDMMIWFCVPQGLPGKQITCRFWWPIAADWAGLG